MPTSTAPIVDLLFNWQTLFGSALGSLIAISIPVFSHWYGECKQRKETLMENRRRIEIEVTMMLEDVFRTEQELKKSIDLIAGTIKKIEEETNPKAYRIGSSNFPVSGDIFCDHELTLLKIGSLYLHNKLLVVNARIKVFNKQLALARDEFTELKNTNKLLAALEKDPSKQRKTYAENLKNFSGMLSMFIKQWIPVILTLLMQTKLYGEKLSNNKDRYENKKIKKDGQKRLDEIDKSLEGEASKEIEEAKRRMEENQKLILKNLPADLVK